MWRFNPFTQKEHTGLEGRTVDIGNIKVHVRNAIAEGGFSCVYLVRDATHSSKEYALKHMVCNDGESLDLVTKEISVLKLLRGHPNVVILVAHAILDMGRTKEALLLMEFCEKPLVTLLANRGLEYFEEKQVILIFRDVCNAVFAMHCQSPPIAHRDLKVENVLLGSDGAWKLCDFGSASTNHKSFNRPEEMGIEEDNIRKHTTPAYRAPEMWDLFRREVISEKVDIWALGCLLYRICYLKSAFDGESKLQILNGNYQIPELPKYSSSVTGLIKDMLEASPDARPDITQVWFRANEQLPIDLRKSLPTSALHDEGIPKKTHQTPPSSSRDIRNVSPQAGSGDNAGPIGAFWSTPHAHDSQVNHNKSMHGQNSIGNKPSSLTEHHVATRYPRKNTDVVTSKRFMDQPTTRASNPESKATVQSFPLKPFLPDASKLNSGSNHANGDDFRSRTEELGAEVDRLMEQLKQANMEKSEITSKYEKLSAICRSQRQELQELRRSLASASRKDRSMHGEVMGGGLLELEQGMLANSSAFTRGDPKPWQAFAEEPKLKTTPVSNHAGSIQNTFTLSSAASTNDVWGLGLDSLAWTCIQGNTPQGFNGDTKTGGNNQPAGWAGF